MEVNLIKNYMGGKKLIMLCFMTLFVIYLQICELPRLVICISALIWERLSEVHFNQLPIRPIADVAKHTENRHTNTQLHIFLFALGQFCFLASTVLF